MKRLLENTFVMRGLMWESRRGFTPHNPYSIPLEGSTNMNIFHMGVWTDYLGGCEDVDKRNDSRDLISNNYVILPLSPAKSWA